MDLITRNNELAVKCNSSPTDRLPAVDFVTINGDKASADSCSELDTIKAIAI